MQVRAEEIARAAHAGQVDKGGHPYIEHPARVAARVRGHAQLEAIAWLHDVVEDTSVTLAELSAEFSPEIVDAVDAMTKRPGESLAEYYRRVRANPLALQVKRADIDDNTDPQRAAQLDERTRARLAAKYAAAREALGV